MKILDQIEVPEGIIRLQDHTDGMLGLVDICLIENGTDKNLCSPIISSPVVRILFTMIKNGEISVNDLSAFTGRRKMA